MESTGGSGGSLHATPREVLANGEPKQRLPEAAHESWRKAEQFLALSDEELSQVDPVVMNLVVAKGIPALAGLDISQYVRLADEWAADLRAQMLAKERQFYCTPQQWDNDIDIFRLGLVAWYCDVVLGVAYREDQRDQILAERKLPPEMRTGFLYTDPTDLFINGVMDTRRGTCGNMALLYVVLGRRVGLPVYLSCAWAHRFCRFDNGHKTINIETTTTGKGAFSLPSDEDILAEENLPPIAKECGSDLRGLAQREMLAMFLESRGRHFDDTRRRDQAERDYLLARYLFPQHRRLYVSQIQLSVWGSMGLFNPDEKWHIVGLNKWLQQVIRDAPWEREQNGEHIKNVSKPEEKTNGHCVDAVFQQIIVGGSFP